jgi:glutamate-1-semialdehyde 2,1-aminomutase
MQRHENSTKLFEEAKRYFAGGVGSSARLTPERPPIYFEKGSGSRLYDVDGNEYIDYVLAWGPLILGHCPSTVVAAVKKQLDSGTIFGSSVPQEVDLSRKVCECLPSVELVRFTNSASEAVHMALRLARAYTGKSKILKFEGSYHGWFDNILISAHPDSLSIAGLENAPYPILEQPGIPSSVLQDILIVPWNRMDIIKKTIQRHGNEIAALILEPIMCNNGVIPPQEGFLEFLRSLTEENEIILIFDETITGFRISLGGAQGYYNIKPDLTVFGKGMGGGYPIAGFGGQKNIMSFVAEGKVGHFGTYNSNSLCVTAALATLDELMKDHGAVYNRITSMGKKLMQGIQEIFAENRLPVVLQGPGPFFSALFTDKPVISYRDTFNLDRPLYSRFWVALLDHGIRIWPSARGLWYLSAAHSENDIKITLEAIRSVASKLRTF